MRHKVQGEHSRSYTQPCDLQSAQKMQVGSACRCGRSCLHHVSSGTSGSCLGAAISSTCEVVILKAVSFSFLLFFCLIAYTLATLSLTISDVEKPQKTITMPSRLSEFLSRSEKDAEAEAEAERNKSSSSSS